VILAPLNRGQREIVKQFVHVNWRHGRNGRITLTPDNAEHVSKIGAGGVRPYLDVFDDAAKTCGAIPLSPNTPGSSHVISADSPATSTALPTEMPTPAGFKATLSLMPSPRNPITLAVLLACRDESCHLRRVTFANCERASVMREGCMVRRLDLCSENDGIDALADFVPDLRHEVILASQDPHLCAGVRGYKITPFMLCFRSRN
jgi:hypothetical protein